MRFTVQREVILKPLQLVSGVVERKQTLPILSNVLLEVTREGLALTGTDLEVEIIARTPLDSAEAGKTTLPARKFMDICRALPEQALIEVSVDKERAVIRSKKSRFVLSTLPFSEFPNIEDMPTTLEISLPQRELKRLIDNTQFAMAQQDVRYYLNGLLLEISNGNLRTVATDGHRLAYCEVKADIKVDENQQIIIPRKGVAEIARLLEDSDQPITIKIGHNHIRIIGQELTFTSKLIDGKFPDYQRVIPHNSDKIIIGDRESLKQALTRASILSNEKYRSIRFQLSSNVLRILAHNPEQEEAEEEIAVNYEGTDLEIGFNATYILDALTAVTTPEAELRLSDPNSCCLILGAGVEDCKYVVMPMRI